MTIIRTILVTMSLLASVAAPALISSQTAYAAGCGGPSSQRLITFPAWYKGLTTTTKSGDCVIQNPDKVGGLGVFIWTIVANLLEIALQAVAYISVGFILYGGFTYLTVASNAEKVTRARKMIQNAVIGLVISLASVAIVNLVTRNL